ncbi:MAG: hypothetical protein HYZ15_09865 [Sphingobacteriales bacterium]|nr:hypothetical protein [Sphingobacteriales bacterium]
MTFLEALYGSQYQEIQQRGGDGSKGRLNANFFLTALLIMALIAVFLCCIRFVPGFNEMVSRQSRNLFGNTSGRSMGKLLAIPLFFLVYLSIRATTGSVPNFRKRVEAFLAYPEDTRKQANKKLLLPFFILLGIVIILALV